MSSTPSSDAERRFLASLHGYDPRTPEASADAGNVRPLLTSDSAPRLRVYQESYYTRLSRNLTATLLDRPAELFGKTRVERLLVDYFAAIPPSARLMTETLASLPAFCASHPWTREAPHVIDVLRLALVRWQVLIARDPGDAATSGAPEDLVLDDDAVLFEAATPAYSLWVTEEDGAAIADIPEAVLVAKTSPTDLLMLAIPEGALPLARALASGRTIAEALDTLAGAVTVMEPASTDFAPLLARLARHGLLRPARDSKVLKPSR